MIVAITELVAALQRRDPSPERDWLLTLSAILVEERPSGERIAHFPSRSLTGVKYVVGERCQCPHSQYSAECFHTRARRILLDVIDQRTTPTRKSLPSRRVLSAAEMAEIQREVDELFA